MLARPAESITLLDVYRAVESEELFALHRSEPDPECPVGRTIQPILSGIFQKAQRALEAELSKITIADVTSDVEQRSRGRPAVKLPAARPRAV